MSDRTFNHKDRETRLRRSYERLGTDDPACLLCDKRNPLPLELHHPAKHRYHDHTVIMCGNHHPVLSDWAKDHPLKIPGCTNQLEAASHLLYGWSDMVELACNELRDPTLADFLGYLHPRLKTLALALNEMARLNPKQDMGVTL